MHRRARAPQPRRAPASGSSRRGDRSKFGLTTARDRGRGGAPAEPRACSTACSSCTSTSAARSRTSAPSRTPCARRAASTSSCTAWARNMRYLDCGGGLGVDYDGSQTNFHSSVNYTLQEYATDVVSQVAEACNAPGRAPSRHRHRVGPRARRPPLGAGVQRARHERDPRAARVPDAAGPRRAPRHPAALRDLRRASRARTSRRRTTTPSRSRKRPSPPSTSASSTCEARARRRAALLGDLREDPEDRPRPALRARRARGAREAAHRHLLLQLLALPVAARQLGRATSSSPSCPSTA